MKRCSVAGCDRPYRCSSFCAVHYARLRRTGSPAGRRFTVEERFWSKVEKTETCWLWLAAKGEWGHGTFNPTRDKRVMAYRWSYEALVGPIPDGLVLDHLCRNPPCVNPAHLEPVTAGENTLRGFGASGVHARQTHCIRGHEFDEENTYINPKTGWRTCRACGREAKRKAAA